MVARNTLPELPKTLMVATMEVGGVASFYAVGGTRACSRGRHGSEMQATWTEESHNE